MSQLKIYRASAGSGKTYTLTKEFLFLLFKNPVNYIHTLAVTFTNKATGEMKSRILEKLFQISTYQSDDYIEDLKNEFKLPEKQLRKRAGVLLSYLLHDFSNFSVSTIDSFFQKIIRSFAREAGLESGFKIELNGPKVLQKAIDHLLLKIDLPEYNHLKNWLVQFAEQKLNQGKNWNLTNDLNKLGSEIFNELFQLESRDILVKLSNKEWMQTYLDKITTIKSEFEKKIIQIGEEGSATITKAGLKYDDFTGKSRTPVKYFEKLKALDKLEPGSALLKIIDEPEKWTRKDNPPNVNEDINGIYPLLNMLIKKALDIVDRDMEIYNTANVISQNFYALGIIADIAKEVQTICREENIFLIADSSHFLNRIIDQNEAPFIYEKIGSKFQNFMIDEFQDTSKLQWLNFKPLIDNSLSSDETSLIVGDVKQSIYRWRNSDWNLLNHQITKDFRQHGSQEKTLNHNWRSRSNIIKFNNSVFTQAAKLIQTDFNNNLSNYIHDKDIQEVFKNKISSAYSDVYQQIPEHKLEDNKGYIYSKFIDPGKDQDYNEIMLHETVGHIENLISKGYSYSDICILVRKKGEGEIIANALLSGSYSLNHTIIPVVSNESLFLSGSSAINFIMAQVKFLQNPENLILKADMVLNRKLLEVDSEEQSIEIGRHFEFNSESKFKTMNYEWIDHLLSKKQKPLFELIEYLANQLPEKIKKEQSIFIQSFINCTNQFIKDHYPDLTAYIEWWNDKGNAEAISVPDDQNAIKIMTVHKSKGLEFKAVLMPYCNWKLDAEITSNIIWCQPNQSPFDNVKLLPVTYTSKLKNTIFKNEYFEEQLYQFVDSINLLYVAFTRSCEVLITFGPVPAKTNKDGLKTVSDLLYNTFSSHSIDKTQNGYLDIKSNWNEEEKIFCYGVIPENQIEHKNSTSIESMVLKPFSNTLLNNDQIAIKTVSSDFFSKDIKQSRVNYGNVMHEAFEYIIAEDDVEKALNRLMFEGKISETEKRKLNSEIKKLISQDKTKQWYNKENKIKTESTIISKQGTYRPDRVVYIDNSIHVIDYKFGEIKDKKYENQLLQYIRQIKQIENRQVLGFIWYVTLGTIINVTPNEIQGKLF